MQGCNPLSSSKYNWIKQTLAEQNNLIDQQAARVKELEERIKAASYLEPLLDTCKIGYLVLSEANDIIVINASFAGKLRRAKKDFYQTRFPNNEYIDFGDGEDNESPTQRLLKSLLPHVISGVELYHFRIHLINAAKKSINTALDVKRAGSSPYKIVALHDLSRMERLHIPFSGPKYQNVLSHRLEGTVDVLPLNYLSIFNLLPSSKHLVFDITKLTSIGDQAIETLIVLREQTGKKFLITGFYPTHENRQVYEQLGRIDLKSCTQYSSIDILLGDQLPTETIE